MVARGLLANPAMFAGYEETPLKCIWDWVDLALELGTPYMCFHQHLMYMMEKITSRQEKRVFNALSSTTAVLDYLADHYGIWLDFLSYFNIYFKGSVVNIFILNKTFYFNTKSMTHNSVCKLTWSIVTKQYLGFCCPPPPSRQKFQRQRFGDKGKESIPMQLL